MPLPSMIRVDAVGRMDFEYDDISEALGEESRLSSTPRSSRRTCPRTTGG
ncbi:MAG: MmoB/DmpM family protein [Geodermatophilaceae bacterium]